MEVIIAAISSVGFPIVAVIGCAGFIYKINEDSRADMKAREDRMFSQLEKFANSMDNFNDTLCSIDSRLEAVEGRKNTVTKEKEL